MLLPTSSTPNRTQHTLVGLPFTSVTTLPKQPFGRDASLDGQEVELDFAREWVEFYDPENPEHLIKADMT